MPSRIWKYGAVAVAVSVAGLAATLAVSAPRITQAQQSGVDITVYNSDIALVKEARQFNLKQGVNTVQVTDVPSAILPETVYFKSRTDPQTVVLEQNYEYDIVGSQKLLQKYVDQPITVVTQDGTTYEGVLLSGADDVILQNDDGGVDVIKWDQIRQYSFPALPEGLITKPTLVWMLEAAKAGTHNTELAYLTSGMNWLANYVLVLADDSKTLDLDGWITLDNRSGASFEDARLKLVAGDVNRVYKEMYAARTEAAMVDLAAAPTPAVSERSFSEYHLYEIERPVTIKQNETKQIQFLTAADVPAQKEYVYDASLPYSGYPIYDQGYGSTGDTKVSVSLTFNTGEKGVNAQLPAGTIRMYQPDVDGSPLFIGEDSIGHTPKGEDVTLTIGQAFDLVGERTQTNFERIGDKVVEETYTIELRNQKESEAVEIRVVEHLSRGTDWEIISASPEDWTKTDSNTIEWNVKVPAKGSATITYTVRYEF